MDKERKVGTIFIVIGILVPLIVLPFVSGFSKDKGFYDNFFGAAIELSKDEFETIGAAEKDRDKPKGFTIEFSRLKPKRIPFRFFLAFTLIFLYVGIVKIDSARRKAKEDAEQKKEE